MIDEKKMTDIWKKYEACRDYLDSKGLVSKTQINWDFYCGDQWKNLQTDGRYLPMLPFIKQVCRYKVSTVAQNSLVAAFSDLEHSGKYKGVCELLDRDFAKTWERAKLDTAKWEIVKGGCVEGDHYAFFGTDNVEDMQLLHNTSVMFGNEQEADIQKQPYIIIYERMLVSEAIRLAKENDAPKEDIETIRGDEDTQYELGNKDEVKTSQKVGVVLYMEKKDGIVYKARSTKTCVVEPLAPIARTKGGKVDGGLRSYPIVSFIWEKMPNSARGNSEVKQLIPNQIELNKTLVRRSESVKMTAFPRIAYDKTAIQNPEDLERVGGAIAMNGVTSNIDQMIKYLNPASMSHDAESLQTSILDLSMQLAGAQDTALGNIDPQRVSGAAIEAIRDQTALPLNEQVAAYRQFAEDLAMVRYDMLYAYAPPEGVDITYEVEGTNPETGQPEMQTVTERIPLEVLKEFRPHVRIDVSADNSWSKYAQQQELAGLLNGDKITLEEYLKALPDNGSLPKNKLLELIGKRGAMNGEGNQNVPVQEMPPDVYGSNEVQSPLPEMQGDTGAGYNDWQ